MDDIKKERKTRDKEEELYNSVRNGQGIEMSAAAIGDVNSFIWMLPQYEKA